MGGQCGCSDFNAQHKFAGPDGYTYALEVTQGCDGCGTPAGVIIHRFDRKTADQWDVGELPELPFRGFNEATANESAEYYQPIADPALILEELRKIAKANEEQEDEEDICTADELLDFEGEEAIVLGIDATLTRHEEQLRKVSP